MNDPPSITNCYGLGELLITNYYGLGEFLTTCVGKYERSSVDHDDAGGVAVLPGALRTCPAMPTEPRDYSMTTP